MAAAYTVVAWIVIEVADLLTETFNAPDWVLQVFIILLVLGLPISIVLAWAFDLTQTGVTATEWPSDTKEKATPDNDFVVNESSLAVIPLDYYGESKDRYLADGITEDLTTLLSRTPGLFVIARNSSSRYGGGNVSVRKVGEELGVRYVVEGSVRRLSQHLRLNVQLIEAATEKHIWAQRFDFSEDDLIKKEEDICHRIATQLVSSLEKAESSRAQLLPLRSQDSWLLTQRAIHKWWSGPDSSSVREAFSLVGSALERDPDYPYALAFYGFLCSISQLIGIETDIENPVKAGMESLQKALRLSPDDPFVLFYWGVVLGFTGDRKGAISTLQRAKEGNPNDPHILADLGFFLTQVGRNEEGLEMIQQAFRLSPFEPRNYVWHLYLGSERGMRDPEAALDQYEKSLAGFSRYTPALLGKIITLGLLRRDAEAQETCAFLRESHPHIGLEDLKRMLRTSTQSDDELATYFSILEKHFEKAD